MYEESNLQSEVIRDLFAFMDKAKAAVFTDETIDGKSFENYRLMPNQYLYFINFTTSEVPYHKNLTEVLGYTEKVDLPLLMNIVHPDDVNIVTKVSEATLAYLMQCKIKDTFAINLTISNRTRKKDGSYVKILRQMTIVDVDDTGNILSAVAICSDITNIKSSNEVTYKLDGPENHVFYEIVEKLVESPTKPILTEREIEIVQLLAKGKSSKEIANKLFISQNTVGTHRKNMMNKMGASNVVDLIIKSRVVI